MKILSQKHQLNIFGSVSLSQQFIKAIKEITNVDTSSMGTYRFEDFVLSKFSVLMSRKSSIQNGYYNLFPLKYWF